MNDGHSERSERTERLDESEKVGADPGKPKDLAEIESTAAGKV